MKRAVHFAIAVLSLFLITESAYAQQARPELMTGEKVRPLGGWNVFCEDYAPVCDTTPMQKIIVTLTPEAREVLEEVNRDVNHRNVFMTDTEHWGRSDPRYVYLPEGVEGAVDKWSYAEDGLGDCEDYALLKQKMLLEKGWPRSSLLLTVVDNSDGDGHMVLTVITTGGELILSSETDTIRRWWETNYSRFRNRQSQEDPNVWVSLTEPPTLVSEKKN